jgi:hypothetical protein
MFLALFETKQNKTWTANEAKNWFVCFAKTSETEMKQILFFFN